MTEREAPAYDEAAWQRIWQPASRREAVPEAVVRAPQQTLPHRQRKLFR